MLVTPSGIVIFVKLQLLKALLPILVILPNIIISERRMQPANVPLSIAVTPSGIMNFSSPVQTKKADLPMLVTLEGIVISLRL